MFGSGKVACKSWTGEMEGVAVGEEFMRRLDVGGYVV